MPNTYWDIFKNTPLPNPVNYKSESDIYADGWGRMTSESLQNLELWRRVYYTMAMSVDANVGKLLTALYELNLAENTIVVFSSDHGEMFGAHGLLAKNTFYEEAARVPFLIRWPGRIRAGRESRVCLGTVDIMPTLLGLMGLPIPQEVEGMNLSKSAIGTGGPEPEAAFLQNTGACAAWENGHEWRALRDKRYTYAKYRVDGKELLFDNVKDPFQMNDLSMENRHRDLFHTFHSKMADKMASLNDTFEACTWYKQNWTDGNRAILRGAKG